MNNIGHLVTMQWSSGETFEPGIHVDTTWHDPPWPDGSDPPQPDNEPCLCKKLLMNDPRNEIRSDARCHRTPPRSLCPWLDRSDYRPQLDVLRPELFQDVPRMLNQIRVWGIWKQGQQTPWAICQDLRTTPEQEVWQNPLSCCEGHCQWG